MSVLNLPCSICSVILRNVYEICGTNCGHLFHARCLNSQQTRNPSRRCPKCQLYSPAVYKLFDTPEEIEKINALEMKLQTLTKEKDQLDKRNKDIKTELEKEIAKLKADVQLNGDKEKEQREAYKKRLSHHKEEFAKQKLQLEKDVVVKNKQLSDLETSSGKEIEQLKTRAKMIGDMKNAMQTDYDQRITSLKSNLTDLTKQKDQLATELNVKNSQLEEYAKETEKFKSLAQASEEKASRLLREYGRRTGDLKEELVKDKEEYKKELDLKNKQLIELQIVSENSKQQQVEIEKLRETIKSLQERNSQQSRISVGPTKMLTVSEATNEVVSQNNNQKLCHNEETSENQLSAVDNGGTERKEIVQLKEKIKTLEQRLHYMSEELDKEILRSTQLVVENLKLQSYVDCMKNDVPLDTHDTKVQSTTNPRYITQKPDEVSPFKSLNMRRNGYTNNSIVVQNYPRQNLIYPVVSTVMALGDDMNIAISKEDIEKANVMGGGQSRESSETISLYVQFKTIDMKLKFLTNQHKLTMKMVKIKEFFDKQA